MQLRAYFKQEPLKAITAKRITEYRAWRASQTREMKAGETMQVTVRRTRNAERGTWHLAPHPEAGETLGAGC